MSPSVRWAETVLIAVRETSMKLFVISLPMNFSCNHYAANNGLGLFVRFLSGFLETLHPLGCRVFLGPECRSGTKSRMSSYMVKAMTLDSALSSVIVEEVLSRSTRYYLSVMLIVVKPH